MTRTVGWWRRATSRYRKLPDFLIIGAQRSGTSALYQYITHHPNARGAFRKELHYFDRHYDRGADWYRACFPFHGFTGEASPSYLFHPDVPARVAEVLPGIKLIAILRNPVDRAYSAYQRNLRRHRETRLFTEALAGGATPEFAYVERGLYAEQIERWLKRFKRDQILVLSAEKFFADTSAVLDRLFKFLELPAWGGHAAVKRWIEKKYSYDRYPAVEADVRRKLADEFRPHNERLYRLIGESFDWEA